MNLNIIIEYSRDIVTYLENDKISFLNVINSDQCPGKLGFAMASTAMAAFDTYAWILFQKFDLSKSNRTLFSTLLNDTRFFDKAKYINEKAFYSVIRCGVMHQLYPKDAILTAIDTTQIFYNHNEKLWVNSYALFCDVLQGIKKIDAYITSLSKDEKLNLSIKLLLRTKVDEEEADNCSIDLSTLPSLNSAFFEIAERNKTKLIK